VLSERKVTNQFILFPSKLNNFNFTGKTMSNSPKIIQVYPEKGNMGKVLPEYLSEWTTKKVREEGAEVIPEAFVTGVSMDKGQLAIKLNNGNIVCRFI
jgi:apoptosis-inducing factor 1